MAGRTAREQQVRDVRARNQQHDADRAEQQDESLTVVVDDVVVKRQRRDGSAGVGLRVLLGKATGDRRQLALGLSDGGARPQPANCVHERGAAPVHHAGHELICHHGDPDFDAIRQIRKFEPLRHHADDREPCAVQRDQTADDSGIGGKSPPPQRLRQDGDRCGAFHVVVRFEEPPGHRLDPEYLEKLGGDE